MIAAAAEALVVGQAAARSTGAEPAGRAGPANPARVPLMQTRAAAATLRAVLACVAPAGVPAVLAEALAVRERAQAVLAGGLVVPGRAHAEISADAAETSAGAESGTLQTTGRVALAVRAGAAVTAARALAKGAAAHGAGARATGTARRAAGRLAGRDAPAARLAASAPMT